MNKKTIALVLKILVSGGLIWFLVSSIDLNAAKERVFSADPTMLVAAAGAFGLQMFIADWRWMAVLRAMNIALSFLETLRIICIGLFFNQVLPSSIGGDAVRIYKIYKAGITLSRAINSVMLDRVATVLGLLLITAFALPFFIDKVGEAEARLIVLTVLVLAVGGIVGVVVLMFLDTLPSRYSHFKLVHGMAQLAADTRTLFLSPVHGSRVMVISLIGHVNVALGVYLIAQSLELAITWVDCMVLMPPVLLLMTVPISIAGWGVREGAMVTAFALIGIPAEGVLVMSVMFGIGAILVSLPGGLIFMLSGDRTIPNIEPANDSGH